jgi:hypothetical protein
MLLLQRFIVSGRKVGLTIQYWLSIVWGVLLGLVPTGIVGVIFDPKSLTLVFLVSAFLIGGFFMKKVLLKSDKIEQQNLDIETKISEFHHNILSYSYSV